MNKIQISSINAVIVITIIIIQMMSLYDISNSALDQISILVTFGLLCFMSIVNGRIFSYKTIFFVAWLNIISLLITTTFHKGIGSTIMMMNLLLMFFLFNNIFITQEMYKIIHLITIFFLTIYIFTLDLSNILSTIIIDKLGNSFNSNMFALFVLAVLLHFICFVNQCKLPAKIKKIIVIPVFCLASYYIIISDSRTALTSATIFLFLCICKRKPFSNENTRKLAIMGILFSLIFPILYVMLFDNNINIELLGKSLYSGRQYVWKAAFDAIIDFPIFGSGNDILLPDVRDYTVSAHNTILGMIKMFGIIPTVSFVFFFAYTYKMKNINRDKISEFAIISTLPCMFFESFYTNSHLYVLFALFFLSFIKYDKQEKRIY